ncbi:PGF-pre-PGF domain-containing protein [Methanosarcina sp. UBA289]|uniref:PGF-pre-PGF domain-containing protein n=1 Tax=Methanosarcina sp. UBA289 TaxID=1915574 RepID=UPI0025ED5782|nr:PGF-pre-PGF domain-containing protein [Methanosarcina sp. UBA289]
MKDKENIHPIALASITAVSFLIIVLSTASAATEQNVWPKITETRITTSGFAYSPDIYGDRIVWINKSNGKHDIYMYNLSTSKETQITTNSSYKGELAIYGNRIVWKNYLNGEPDIYTYDLSTHKETQITNGTGYPTDYDIYGDRIVWHDNLNNSIYMYNLSTHKKTQIPTSGTAYYPAIYGDRIAWISEGNIYLYDLSTSKETQITTGKTAYNPAIHEDKIVWEDYRSGHNIYMYNLSTSQETQITTSGIAYNPDIYGDRIVWRNGRSENVVVYIYDLSTPKITRITTAKSNQIQPSVYNDRIVWLDNRNDNNDDIYMGTISGFKTLVANFSSNVTGGFPPLSVKFIDLSENATEWNWNFGDGNNSTDQNPMHTYSSAGNYTINLTATNGNSTDSKLYTIDSKLDKITVIRPVAYAYITTSTGVYVIDTTTNTVTARINTGSSTHGVAVSPDGTKVYVTNDVSSTDNSTVSIIDASINTVTATVPVGKWPYGIAVSPDGKKVYVANEGSNNVSVIDTATSKVTDTVNTRISPYGVAVTPDGTKVYVTNSWNRNVSVIDTATNKVTATVNTEDGTYGVVVSPDGKKVYVANYRSKNVSVIDTATDTVIATIEVGYGPIGLTVTPDGKKVYVANEDKTISVIDTATNTVIAVVNVISEPFGIAVTPDGKNVYVANKGMYFENISYFDHNVSVIDTDTNTVKTVVAVGYTPIAFGQFIGKKSTLPINAPVSYIADFSANVTSGYAPLSVQFTDRSGNATGWNWVFGDGVTSTEKNPMHTYSTAGNYTVNLTVNNAKGTAYKTNIVTVFEESSSNGGSSGGSSHSSFIGGAGGSLEPASSVQVKELSQAYVTSGKTVKFDFPKNATCVVYVIFDAKKTFGKTTTIAEQLKGKSSLVSGLPEGEVYKSFNIWVGNGGIATSKNIENPVVCLKVERFWVTDKNIDQDSITLNRYNDKKWEQFPVNLLMKDNKYLYFTAKTSGFSSFAITGTVKPSEEAVTKIEIDYPETINKNNTENKEPQAEQKDILKTTGFEIYYGVASLLAVLLYKRK